MQRLYLVSALALAACATATTDHQAVDAQAHGGDAPATSDAAMAMADASSGCHVVTKDLLTNGNFDAAPLGTGWAQTPIDPTLPIVTPDDGIVEQSAPNKAWMGGAVSASDDLHQDVMVPASTTALHLTGFYEVRTGETLAVAYDTGKVELVQTSGTVIESVLALDNAHATTAWTAIDHAFTTSVAGQTVRLRFTSSNDSSLPTSFYFDTLALSATYCQ